MNKEKLELPDVNYFKLIFIISGVTLHYIYSGM